jgi:hypothetical protein
MMTIASPLMGKEVAKFAYLLMVSNHGRSPHCNTVLVWKMVPASARSRGYAPARSCHFAAGADLQIGAVLP